jgi:hypothetical protein
MPRVAALVLARVIVSPRNVGDGNARRHEAVSASDLAYLQRFYAVVNTGGDKEMAPEGDC